jgi:glycosyltransferase involved in cell wall biosynthesis
VKISATIISHNEEKNIARAINSLTFADEIIVVDSESTDRTREISESLGAKVYIQKWLGFAKQKQFAVERAANNFIFSLDADEEVSKELAATILKLKALPEEKLADGYEIPRLSYYMNRAIRHSGWYPDSQLRLFNRRLGAWKDVEVHESIQMKDAAKLEKLNADILHFSVENAGHHHRMIGERYAPLAARQMYKDGKTTSKLKIHTAGMFAFLRSYLIKGGFLDGLPGFAIARFAAHHSFLKHLILWELQNDVDNSDQ